MTGTADDNNIPFFVLLASSHVKGGTAIYVRKEIFIVRAYDQLRAGWIK